MVTRKMKKLLLTMLCGALLTTLALAVGGNPPKIPVTTCPPGRRPIAGEGRPERQAFSREGPQKGDESGGKQAPGTK
ncbi:MAG: hypothetical protein Ct9H300mP1_15070 [Planctomycetaceae bacterium]|nr:MAG: hypothetical protein Ct9H300mP1_15070 [Planctomycetaceae bacterium]